VPSSVRQQARSVPVASGVRIVENGTAWKRDRAALGEAAQEG
jgi:hypothetical protein